jgi:hypothetical protein
LFYGVTESNRLVTFASDSPGAVRSSVPISGTLESESIEAIDVRPASGALYGLGSASILYRIDPGSGRASAVGPQFAVPIRGSSHGLAFDPVNDVARLVSDAEGNMRVDPDTGLVVDSFQESVSVQPDRDLGYPEGDPSAGRGGSNVGAVAYTPDTLFGLDTSFDTLVRIDPPGEGVLHTVGPLGLDAGDGGNGFDLGSDGAAYAVLGAADGPGQRLYAIDLASGRASAAARLPELGTYLGRRRDPVRALAGAGRVPDDTTRPGLVFTAVRTPRVRGLLRGRALVVAASCTEACRIRAVLRSGRRAVARQVRFVRERAGLVRLRLRLTRKGRRVVRRNPARRLRLGMSARDMAGNVTRTGRRRR